IANIRLKYLNESLQRRFNYDAQAATEAERQQAEDDARYQAALAADVAARAQQAALAAQQAAATSERNFVDSISDKSPIGKPAPSLQASQWVGEKPDTEGKFVLRFYWAPWSVPCRQAIAGINGLQKQYADQLAVIGVTTDSAESLENMPGEKPEFASVLDPEAKAITAAGITYVPQVLLMDPNGALVFQGHPGAINSTNLSLVLVRPE
ncbi:MAG TPA: TlpA disulfide reductase family protein, partial [Clostridia bacterium]|nr:TlpA disulfide reductase family protein [Clostridia bacterium]